MRWIGFLHCIIFVPAIYLVQPLLAEMSVRRRLLLSAVAVFLLGDYMYTGYFNSFYMDAATYVFLVLAVVLFLRAARWRRWADSVSFVVCVVLMVLSKSQHAVLGIWISALLGLFGACLWPRNGRALSIWAAVLVDAAVLLGLESAPPEYAARAYYSVIFYQVLPHSTDVTRDREALGLDSSYRRWVGTHAYSTEAGMNDPAFVRDFYGKDFLRLPGMVFSDAPARRVSRD
jgi:hypothetical protein